MIKSEKAKGVFFDRDGVLNKAIIKKSKPYPPSSLTELEIFADALPSIEKIKSLGYLTFIVTNQPDVPRGITAKSVVTSINTFIQKKLMIDDVYTCFHDDSDMCTCRKPLPGGIFKLAEKFNINLEKSFMIGDRWRDIESGKAAKCRTILIDNDYDERKAEGADYVVDSLSAVAAVISELNREAE